MSSDGWRLFYDGTCNLCHASMKRLKQWARRRNHPLEVHTLQSPSAQEKGYESEMILEADGRVYRGADAWLRAMAVAPWYLRWVAAMRFTPLTRWLAVSAYGLVARNRHRILGRRETGVLCGT